MVGEQVVGEPHHVRGRSGADVGEFSDEPVTQRGDSGELGPLGVQSHGVLIEGFVVRVVTDGLFDDRGRSGQVGVSEQFGEGEVRIDRLSAGRLCGRRCGRSRSAVASSGEPADADAEGGRADGDVNQRPHRSTVTSGATRRAAWW